MDNNNIKREMSIDELKKLHEENEKRIDSLIKEGIVLEKNLNEANIEKDNLLKRISCIFNEMSKNNHERCELFDKNIALSEKIEKIEKETFNFNLNENKKKKNSKTEEKNFIQSEEEKKKEDKSDNDIIDLLFDISKMLF